MSVINKIDVQVLCTVPPWMGPPCPPRDCLQPPVIVLPVEPHYFGELAPGNTHHFGDACAPRSAKIPSQSSQVERA